MQPMPQEVAFPKTLMLSSSWITWSASLMQAPPPSVLSVVSVLPVLSVLPVVSVLPVPVSSPSSPEQPPTTTARAPTVIIAIVQIFIVFTLFPCGSPCITAPPAVSSVERPGRPSYGASRPRTPLSTPFGFIPANHVVRSWRYEIGVISDASLTSGDIDRGTLRRSPGV